MGAFSPNLTTMQALLYGSLLLAFLSLALAQDATCKTGESETTVTIGAGDSFKYKTSAKGKYKHNVNCVVNYLMDESCAEMKFTCKKINIKNKKDCSKGDTLVISTEDDEKVVCGKKKFVFTSTSDMMVEFLSDGKKAGAGAKGCKVTCSRAATTPTTTTSGAPTTATTGAPTTTGAPSTTAEVPATTAAPTTTTEAPTTTTTTAESTTPTPCVNCTTTEG